MREKIGRVREDEYPALTCEFPYSFWITGFWHLNILCRIQPTTLVTIGANALGSIFICAKIFVARYHSRIIHYNELVPMLEHRLPMAVCRFQIMLGFIGKIVLFAFRVHHSFRNISNSFSSAHSHLVCKRVQ